MIGTASKTLLTSRDGSSSIINVDISEFGLSRLLLLMLFIFLGCYNMRMYAILPMLWRYVTPPSSGLKYVNFVWAYIQICVHMCVYIYIYIYIYDRLCGLVVRVLGCRFGGPGSIPGTTRIKKLVVGLERGPLSLVSTTEELLDRKVTAPV
jgi:hypothetical protein